jgi:hypothetical protein
LLNSDQAANKPMNQMIFGIKLYWYQVTNKSIRLGNRGYWHQGLQVSRLIGNKMTWLQVALNSIDLFFKFSWLQVLLIPILLGFMLYRDQLYLVSRNRLINIAWSGR